ncbi:hypothetical protein E2C01_000481 [Portunus trituberculatus]|uniref:Uncharacterized protein n=1 Tax=Portunus trituberculatus TaxID=210409 RepID=A0A5B7CE70_PORTR|nr:hypothetical protein [Portunus trituberculatus]
MHSREPSAASHAAHTANKYSMEKAEQPVYAPPPVGNIEVSNSTDLRNFAAARNVRYGEEYLPSHQEPRSQRCGHDYFDGDDCQHLQELDPRVGERARPLLLPHHQPVGHTSPLYRSQFPTITTPNSKHMHNSPLL